MDPGSSSLIRSLSSLPGLKYGMRFSGTATWSVEGLAGDIDASGTLHLKADAPNQVGKVVATAGSLKSVAEVRITAPLPWSEDFESIAEGNFPRHWLRVGKLAKVVTLDGNKVLRLEPPDSGVAHTSGFMGPASMSGYTVQADVHGSQQGRRRPDIGLINSGYTLDLQGGYQRLEIRTWDAELRVREQVPFEWDMNTWYTEKLRVDIEGDKAVVRGKVWPRDQPEPAEWTVTAEDPYPVRNGSPGLYGYSPVDLYFDNVKVMVNP